MYKLIKFGAPWCGPCRQAEKDLEKSPIEGVMYESISVDDNDAIVEEYGISSVPVFLLLNENNQEVSRQIGYPGLAKLNEWVKNYAE